VDPLVNGRLKAIEKRVSVLEGKVDLTNKKLDQVLAALGPVTKWVQEQTEQTAQTKEYVWVASEYGEHAFRRGSTGDLEVYFQDAWRTCYLPYKGTICVVWHNTYYAVGCAPQAQEALSKNR